MSPKPKVMPRTSSTSEDFQRAFLENYIQGKDRAFATPYDNYVALAFTVRERLIQHWLATGQAYIRTNARMVYYLSAEYLMGRQLSHGAMEG